jgi:hypothetical protein
MRRTRPAQNAIDLTVGCRVGARNGARLLTGSSARQTATA